MTCKDHAQFWGSEVVEYNRRWSTYTNLTVPLNKDGLLILVKGGIYGSVDFVEDDSLVNEAYVHFYIEFGETVIGKTKFCTLEYPHDNRSGVGIFVSVSLSHRVFSVRFCVLTFGFRDGFRDRSIPEGRGLW